MMERERAKENKEKLKKKEKKKKKTKKQNKKNKDETKQNHGTRQSPRKGLDDVSCFLYFFDFVIQISGK